MANKHLSVPLAEPPIRTILQSWKEIASELNRGVRTVQRWEKKLKMPVRRVGEGPRAPVFAFTSELHIWLRSKDDDELELEAGPLQAIEALFRAQPSRGVEEKCIGCGSPMQFMKGQFWIYGTRKKWKVSIPLCPVCDGGDAETLKDTLHQIHVN